MPENPASRNQESQVNKKEPEKKLAHPNHEGLEYPHSLLEFLAQVIALSIHLDQQGGQS